MSTPLDQLFSDKPIVRAEVKDEPEVETPAPETETPPEPEKPPDPAKAPDEVDKPTENAQPRDNSGKFAKTVPHEAFHAERERRKELEAKLAELTKKPPTSVLEDEDKAFSERLTQVTRPIAQRLFNMSVAAAKRVPGREDYDEVYDYMNEEVQKHPELMRDIDAADDPGEYLYQLGKTRKELAEVGGDITKLREAATAKVAKELNESKATIKQLQAEVAALKASQEKRERIPQSTNSEASAATKDDAFAGPTPLKKLFTN